MTSLLTPRIVGTPCQPEVLGNYTRLEEVVFHPELFKAYPQFKAMPVVNSKAQPTHGDWGKEMLGVAAAYISGNGKSDLLAINPFELETTPILTVLHEIQHAIQDQEGYFAGALLSPDGDAQEDIALYYASPQEREALNVEARLLGSKKIWFEEKNPKHAGYPKRVPIFRWDERLLHRLESFLKLRCQQALFRESIEAKVKKLAGLSCAEIPLSHDLQVDQG